MQEEIFGRRAIDPKFLDNFYLRRLNSTQHEVAEDYVSTEIQRKYTKFGSNILRLLTEIIDKEGCHVFGQLITNKVCGKTRF